MEENEFVENWTNIRDKYSNEMVDILLENGCMIRASQYKIEKINMPSYIGYLYLYYDDIWVSLVRLDKVIAVS